MANMSGATATNHVATSRVCHGTPIGLRGESAEFETTLSSTCAAKPASASRRNSTVRGGKLSNTSVGTSSTYTAKTIVAKS